MSGRRALFLRHGQSAHNAHTGSEELSAEEGDLLTELGQAQARAAGRGIAALELGVDRLLTSPMRRARETAAALAGPLGLEPEVVPHAHEMGGDGESFDQALGRVRQLRAGLEARPAEELPLLVTHGIFTRFFLLDAMLGERFEESLLVPMWHLASANCGLTTFASGLSRYPDGVTVPGWTCLSWMERPWDRP
ncbi:MAG: histidine phosphatase family protein [Actinobacteria bacterium]|nr:histidine phosphatase family protein [Actinomycetota bacterium]